MCERMATMPQEGVAQIIARLTEEDPFAPELPPGGEADGWTVEQAYAWFGVPVPAAAPAEEPSTHATLTQAEARSLERPVFARLV